MNRKDIRIAVDAMGGDYAPRAPVRGAVWAAREYGQPIVLVGREDEIETELALDTDVPSSLIEIRHAPEVVGMEEAAAGAIKKKKESSIRVAFEVVKRGEADGVVSAGNSGATMAGAALIWGRTAGVSRPAIAGVFPTLNAPTVVIDVGANVNCKPKHLFQFGMMGDIFARHILHLEDPKVGLLNIGEESMKGNELVKSVHELLSEADLNFVGNVEGRDVFTGETQVIICDGFVGNVCLKLSEGLGQAMMSMLKAEISKTLFSRLGAFFAKDAFRSLKKKVDYVEQGGAPLLGVNGAGVVCHGSSPPKAVKNAVRVATDLVISGMNERLSQGLDAFSSKHTPKELS